MRTVILSLVTSFLLAVAAQATTADTTRMQKLLRTIGIDTYLASFAEDVGGADNPMARSIGGIAEAWTTSSLENFAPEEMFADVVYEMNGRLSDGHMSELEHFFAAPLGRRIAAMEVAAQRPGVSLTVKTEGADLLGSLIDSQDNRLEQLGTLIDALSAEETGLAMALSLNRAVLSGMSASGRLPYKLSSDQIDALVSSQRRLIRGTIRDQLLISMAYTYQTLSDGELDRYIAFLKTDAGQQFYIEMLIATQSVISERAHRFGERLMEHQATENL